MKLSFNTLKQFVKIHKTAREIADGLTLSLSEIERVETYNTDTILEIENKALTHRPDCFSHIGIAREIAAIFNTSFIDPFNKTSPNVPNKFEKQLPLSVVNKNTKLCQRYSAVVLETDFIKKSPVWLTDFLESVGLRPVNSVVDITNYITLVYGQPIHAFDYDKISDHQIIIRNAIDNETIQTLDGKNRVLSSSTLIIADSHKPIALAGIMGGTDTEVTSDTKRILLEVATFEKTNNRKSSKQYNLRSDASTRYEKGLPVELVYFAREKAISLLEKVTGAHVVSEKIDTGKTTGKTKQISTDYKWVNNFLGTTISEGSMVSILERLSLQINLSKSEVITTVPWWRSDLASPADIAEEVARIYGYDKLPTTLPEKNTKIPPINTALKVKKQLGLFLSYSGYNEVLTTPFISEDLYEEAGLSVSNCLQLQNPQNPNQTHMRNSLVPSLLQTLIENNSREKALALYEIDKVFIALKTNEQPKEPKRLCIVDSKHSYEFVKGIIETCFFLITSKSVSFIPLEMPDNAPLFHPKKTAEVFISKKHAGFLGYLHPKTQLAMGLKQNVVVADLNYDLIISFVSSFISYSKISQFPSLFHDITFITPEKTQVGTVISSIKEKFPSINTVSVTARYNSTITLRIEYSSMQKNLTEEDVVKTEKDLLLFLHQNYLLHKK
jgi:phenylalanyl-tRNA synthetase beta chain